MSTLRIKSNELGNVLAQQVAFVANNQILSTVIVDRAKKRISNQGDSTHKYPELWASKNQVGYRKHGKALRDTGFLMSKLHSESKKISSNTVRWTLKDGSGYGVKHQEGFSNKPPIAVPLNKKTARILKWLGEPPHDISLIPESLEEAPSLEEARKGRKASIKWDYYVIEYETKVPPRKIANNPPEDVKAITKVIKRALRKKVKGLK
ncbi:MAG: hypothetical protein Unbinned97contig1000_4 [Prokaryotic dsDNA virus sp.]|nr:MAG: hypothetical protein Unbinned97contig1000_4 [Prokaryotic dsDNA virus sp.]|tara:strand:+ start:1374 stop:1994 length:621 start_codon:yes stop_codon:yes gene_type:complete